MVDRRPVSFGGVLGNVYWLMGVQLVLGECLQVFIGWWAPRLLRESACKCLLVDGRPVNFGGSASKGLLVDG